VIAAADRRMSVSHEHGFVNPLLVVVLWVSTLLGIALVDVGAYLVAAARAQAAADAVALAAVAPGARPDREARRIADVASARLEACRCRTADGFVSVEVSVAVPGLVLPTLGASRVTARADAALVRW
jgi:hypothetical protein